MPVNYKLYQFIIGIDCGVSTGIGIWSRREKKLKGVATGMIHEAMNVVMSYRDLYQHIFVRVEDARQRTWIPNEKNIKERVGRAKGAGSVSRDAKIWEDFLTDNKIPFEMVAPKNNKTKMDADTFKKYTQWEEVTNEHGRDAAMLCFGY
jgi:hypothetical protein